MKTILAIAVLAAATLSGCSGLSARDTNVLGGAAIGGVAGSALGGGALGTVGGAAIGGLIGNEVGKNKEVQQRNYYDNRGYNRNGYRRY